MVAENRKRKERICETIEATGFGYAKLRRTEAGDKCLSGSVANSRLRTGICEKVS